MEKNIQTGKRIQSRREELGMNLGDIAKEVGVAVSTIQRYEKGKIEKMKLPVIEAIAKALQVDPAWLLTLPTIPSFIMITTMMIRCHSAASTAGTFLILSFLRRILR